jgi:hypothetical protein
MFSTISFYNSADNKLNLKCKVGAMDWSIAKVNLI